MAIFQVDHLRWFIRNMWFFENWIRTWKIWANGDIPGGLSETCGFSKTDTELEKFGRKAIFRVVHQKHVVFLLNSRIIFKCYDGRSLQMRRSVLDVLFFFQLVSPFDRRAILLCGLFGCVSFRYFRLGAGRILSFIKIYIKGNTEYTIFDHHNCLDFDWMNCYEFVKTL